MVGPIRAGMGVEKNTVSKQAGSSFMRWVVGRVWDKETHPKPNPIPTNDKCQLNSLLLSSIVVYLILYIYSKYLGAVL